VLGVDDGCHDVAAKGRTNLVKQVFVLSLADWVGVIANLQGGTVGGKTAGEARRDAWSQVATNHGSTHQADLWLDFLEKVDND